jgi:hypothetical protein
MSVTLDHSYGSDVYSSGASPISLTTTVGAGVTAQLTSQAWL